MRYLLLLLAVVAVSACDKDKVRVPPPPHHGAEQPVAPSTSTKTDAGKSLKGDHAGNGRHGNGNPGPDTNNTNTTNSSSSEAPSINGFEYAIVSGKETLKVDATGAISGKGLIKFAQEGDGDRRYILDIEVPKGSRARLVTNANADLAKGILITLMHNASPQIHVEPANNALTKGRRLNLTGDRVPATMQIDVYPHPGHFHVNATGLANPVVISEDVSGRTWGIELNEATLKSVRLEAPPRLAEPDRR